MVFIAFVILFLCLTKSVRVLFIIVDFAMARRLLIFSLQRGPLELSILLRAVPSRLTALCGRHFEKFIDSLAQSIHQSQDPIYLCNRNQWIERDFYAKRC